MNNRELAQKIVMIVLAKAKDRNDPCNRAQVEALLDQYIPNGRSAPVQSGMVTQVSSSESRVIEPPQGY